MKTYKKGQILRIDHARKGIFDIKVTSQTDTAVSGVIVHGTARYISEPTRRPGDEITISPACSLVKITELNSDSNQQDRTLP